MQPPLVRVGTRGSPLALAQARLVAARIAEAHGLGDEAVAITTIRTTGDAVQDRPLAEIGGKGLFTKELEEALLAGTIDLAVHSMKDVATILPAGLAISAILERDDPRDALVSHAARRIADLPQGAVVGTSSLRRAALTRAIRPDLSVVGFRGNVGTRLRKLDAGEADATLLAVAGLNRLGLDLAIASAMPAGAFLPAVAQGAIGIETRAGDARVRELVAPLDHPATARVIAAERAFLAGLDGSCRTPIAGLATIDGREIRLRGLIVKPDGSTVHRTERRGSAADAERLGRDAAAELRQAGGPDFFAV